MRDLSRYGGRRFDDYGWWEGRHKVRRWPASETGYPNSGDEGNGVFSVRMKDSPDLMHVIASNGGDWDHVSVSMENRCPTWDEMCCIKALFFEAYETVIEYHPSETDYVNVHKFCLHLWRPQKELIPCPPKEFVG